MLALAVWKERVLAGVNERAVLGGKALVLVMVLARARVLDCMHEVVVVGSEAVVQVLLLAKVHMLQRVHELAVDGGEAVVLGLLFGEVPVLAGVDAVAVVGVDVVAVVGAEVVVLVFASLAICSVHVFESVQERAVVGGERSCAPGGSGIGVVAAAPVRVCYQVGVGALWFPLLTLPLLVSLFLAAGAVVALAGVWAPRHWVFYGLPARPGRGWGCGECGGV